jgi:hypothetical protein
VEREIIYRARQKIPIKKARTFQKLTKWFVRLILIARVGAIRMHFFVDADFAYYSKIKKHNFHETSNEKAACHFPLFFRGTTVKASALPDFLPHAVTGFFYRTSNFQIEFIHTPFFKHLLFTN